MMTFHRFGERALLINFEQKIDSEINELVIQLSQQIQISNISEITFQTPAYCSLTIGFNPDLISFEDLCKKIQNISTNKQQGRSSINFRKLNIPVCYSESYSIDIQSVINETKLSQTEIIELHTSTEFRVFMIGFLPGFTYMGKLPEPLFCPRKKNPNLRIPAQSVGLAGYQTGIYPSESPGGWQIIGRTPIPIFEPTSENPFLFQAGDLVQFYSITAQDFTLIEQDIRFGQFDKNQLYE